MFISRLLYNKRMTEMRDLRFISEPSVCQNIARVNEIIVQIEVIIASDLGESSMKFCWTHLGNSHCASANSLFRERSKKELPPRNWRLFSSKPLLQRHLPLPIRVKCHLFFCCCSQRLPLYLPLPSPLSLSLSDRRQVFA